MRINVTVLVLDLQAIEPWEEGTGRGDGGTGRRGDLAAWGVEREGGDRTDRAESEIVPDPPVAPSPRPPVVPPRGVRSFVKGLLGR